MFTNRPPRSRAAGGRRRPGASVALLATLVLVLASCAEAPDELLAAEPYECPPEECDPPEPAGPGGELVVEADEFFFEIVEATVAEGTIAVNLTNVGGAEHNFVIDGAVGDTTSVPDQAFLPPGETAEGELELFAGEYVFYCSVPGHRAQGMEGVLEIPAEPEGEPGVEPDVDEDDPDEEGAVTDPDDAGAPEDEGAGTDDD